MHLLITTARDLGSAIAPLAAWELVHRRFSGTLRASSLSLHSMPHSFKPTAEQVAVVDAVLGGGDLKIKAYAGAGKTSTLRLIADHLAGRRGSYLAFNKDIAAHARSGFPPNVSARTVHSLAYACGSSRPHRARESPGRATARIGGPLWARTDTVPTITGKAVDVTSFELGRMVADGLGRFCRSAQLQPEASHIPVDEKVHDTAADWLRESLLSCVVRLWHESTDPRGRSAIAPDVYLKVWAQTEPRIDADFILFDEAQDSDGVMLSVLGLQRHAQIIYVGDPYQQIYEWRGAVNAMAQIDAPERALTESFRFGPTSRRSRVVYSRCLGSARRFVARLASGRSWSKIPSISPPVDAILCRKNVTAIWQLAAGVEAGHQPAIRMSPTRDRRVLGRRRSVARRSGAPSARWPFHCSKTGRRLQSFCAERGRARPAADRPNRRRVWHRLSPRACAADDARSDADYVISTVHRAKGLAMETGKIAERFPLHARPWATDAGRRRDATALRRGDARAARARYFRPARRTFDGCSTFIDDRTGLLPSSVTLG